MKTELKPCPWCGEALFFGNVDDCTHYWYAGCENCDYTNFYFGTKDEVINRLNTRPAEDALKAEVEELKQQLSDSADEGYAGFMLGIEQMKKKLAEKDAEIDRLKAALSDIATIGFEGKIGDKVARETMRRIANSVSAEKGGRG